MDIQTQPQIIQLPSEASEVLYQEQETVIATPRFNNLVRDMKVVRNVRQPSLIAYLPDANLANGTAVVICPGGGFSALPIEIEGTDVAEWLKAKGVAAFVLKYRLLPTATDDETFIQQHQRPDMDKINTHIPLTVEDASQAISLVRKNAAEWNINPQRIGILGFSAGGVVATGAADHGDADSRANFVASIYSPGSTELLPCEDGLPLFMAFASDDPVLKLVSEGSLRLYSTWKDAKQPVEIRIYSKGGHGFGMTQQHLPSDHWIDRFSEWLQVQELMS